MILILSSILGLIVGSFLSMLIPRLHFEETGILWGRSHCFHCKKTLSPRELIPFFSFLIQKGRCLTCEQKIAFWYPIIELSTALTFLVLAFQSSDPLFLIWHFLLFSVLLFIFFYDLRFKEIHDAVMLPALALALLYSLTHFDLQSSFLGLLIGFGFFALQYYGSGGRWIGSGDLRIGAFMGLLLGWPNILVGIFASYILGSFVCLALIATKVLDRKSTVPLGPFLVIGTFIAFFFSDPILHWLLLI